MNKKLLNKNIILFIVLYILKFIGFRKTEDKGEKTRVPLILTSKKNFSYTDQHNTLNTEDTKQSSMLLPFSVKVYRDCLSLE